MAEADRVLAAFKFGLREHMDQFAHGLLYMNTLNHFAKVEASVPRMDSYEGMSYVVRGDGAILSIEFGGSFKPVAELKGPVRVMPDELRGVNVFCMYALRESKRDTLIDPRNNEFGDTVAVLLNFDEFLRRVKVAVPSTGQEFKYNLVEYFDESYRGPVGIFKKASIHDYQSECRLALLPGTGEALKLSVGDLSDIVRLIPMLELNERLRLQTVVNGQSQLQVRL